MEPLGFLLDSSFIIHTLNGDRKSAARFLNSNTGSQLAISRITWIEVMVGAMAGTEADTRQFLAGFGCIELTDTIAERAIAIRRSMHLKLPDAIIYATALVAARTLVTYNLRDFPQGTASVFTLR